ncbi:MAG: hypothetical protein JKY95_00870 [Planctomycetaceae bacterium]|nr:hypothetical protein [Planctomycetaceae bacterium]
MAKIFMSMSGEGRGHATRIRSIVERIRHKHQVTLFAPGDAYQFLASNYADSNDVRLVEIQGMKFHYVKRRLHLMKTITEGFRYRFLVLNRLVNQLEQEIREHKPDVILTDFEPGLPRAAYRCGLPYLSLTHQHFLLAYDLSILPARLRFSAKMMGLAVRLHYSHQQVTMISSFFKSELRDHWKEHAISVGPMIRPEVRNQETCEENYLLSYLRKNTPQRVVEELSHSPVPVKVYGLGEQPPLGNITFHEIDPVQFVNDMTNCLGVVSAAGNQLLGECMYLGKPVLALPEKMHHEQLINSYFLRHMGCGNFVTLERFTRDDLKMFLEHQQKYRTQIEKTCLGHEGTEQVVAVLEKHAQAPDSSH